MAETLPLKNNGYIDAESLAMAASAETLATAGATVPQNTGEVMVFVPTGKEVRWLASETPTTALGNRITFGHPATIPHALQKRAKFKSSDASDVTCIIVYARGAGRQDLAHTKSEPN